MFKDVFILLADGKGLYTLSKLNANLRIVWHLKPIWKKKIVGEIDNTYCSIFGYEILRFGEMILHGS
jgi:hypothetical protein